MQPHTQVLILGTFSLLVLERCEGFSVKGGFCFETHHYSGGFYFHDNKHFCKTQHYYLANRLNRPFFMEYAGTLHALSPWYF